MKRWLAPLSVLCCAATAQAQAPLPPAEPPAEAIQTITAKEIGGHLRFLASDLMKGRDTASPEIRLAGEYLAAHLFAAGAEPMGEPGPNGKTYFQGFPLEITTPKEEGTALTITLDIDGNKRVMPCKLGEDFILMPRGIAAGEVEAEVVFAFHGRSDDKANDYEGLEVKDRFVLVYAGTPEVGNAPAQGGRPAQIFNPFQKGEAAKKNGARGVLVIQPPGRDAPAPRQPLTARNIGFGRTSMTLGVSVPNMIPTVNLNASVRDTLIETLKLKADSKPGLPVGGMKVKFSYAENKETKEDRNVLGYFPGADPEKRKEIVIFSAHYDHEGVRNGEIYNGSDDNASGTSTLLELAEAFGRAPRPARSVAFLWVSGEEKGLLGSQWFSEHMTLPEDHKIVADINLDMVSRNDPKKVSLTPSPKHPDYNTMIPAAQAACAAEGMEPAFDSDSYYFRTDSYNFARKGIPIIFFFTGEHADYHRPTDDFEKADTEKAARIARVAFRLGWQVAQAQEVPQKIKKEQAAENGKP